MSCAVALLFLLVKVEGNPVCSRLPHICEIGGDWGPLESTDGLGEDVAALEPMRRLVEGEYSAIVVRNVLSHGEAATVMKRLEERQLLVRGEHGRRAFGRRLKNSLVDIGFTLHGTWAARFAENAAHQNGVFGTLWDGIVDPVSRFHAVLNNLAKQSGKRVVVPRNVSGTGVDGTSAIIRSHAPVPGSGFITHFDGFKQGPYTPSRHYERWHPVQSEKYTTRSCLSSILVLQGGQGDTAGRLYNASLEELLDDGARPKPHVGGASHYIGVHFDSGIHKFFEETQTKSFAPDIPTGDLYLFSSSRIHETFDVSGQHRVTLASFLQWHDEEPDVLLFQ